MFVLYYARVYVHMNICDHPWCVCVWGGGGEGTIGTIFAQYASYVCTHTGVDHLPQIHALDISTSYLEEREYRAYTHMPMEDNGVTWTRIVQYFFESFWKLDTSINHVH